MPRGVRPGAVAEKAAVRAAYCAGRYAVVVRRFETRSVTRQAQALRPRPAGGRMTGGLKRSFAGARG
jgi:hypothetical protein